MGVCQQAVTVAFFFCGPLAPKHERASSVTLFAAASTPGYRQIFLRCQNTSARQGGAVLGQASSGK
eukprot:9274879-Heterocapsa_arctica.AAC.1